jgi:tRNA nucleotidyltransferase (CCA-adding enzyme)
MQAGGLIERLPPPLLRLTLTAGRLADKSGIRAYIVGGIVRDLMLGRPPVDIDIMAEGDAVQLARQMAEKSGARLTVHSAFGTASLKIDGFSVDLSTCRSESYQHPGALPRVRAGNMLDDLQRRDFTINAMALCINNSDLGSLTDLFGGRQDMERGLVRVLHNKSFQDDATRMMRAVRYEQRLGFKIENNTLKLLRNSLDMLDTISSDRLKNEFALWLNEGHPEKILRRAGRLGMLGKLHPALEWDRPLSTAFRRAASMDSAEMSRLYFCLLVYNLDEEELYELLGRLNLTGSRLDLISHQSLELKGKCSELDKPAMQRSSLYFTLREYDTTAILANHCYAKAPDLRRNLGLYIDRLKHIKASLDGNDLVQLGVKEGPKLGTMLKKLLAARLDGTVRSKPDEVKMARRLAGIQ